MNVDYYQTDADAYRAGVDPDAYAEMVARQRELADVDRDREAKSKRDYDRGYQAGRKRAEQDAKQVRRDALYAAALQGVLANGKWMISGKEMRTIAEHVIVATQITDAAMRELG
jgi:hypothetical protein